MLGHPLHHPIMHNMNTLERTFFLDVPWDQRGALSALGGRWDKSLKSAVYTGLELPVGLQDMQSLPFSYERWHEDKYNKQPLPVLTRNAYTLRPHQKDGVVAIMQAIKRGSRGFILADETGLGKTLISLYGAYAQAEFKGFTPKRRAKVLVVTTKSALPHWRGTIMNTKLTRLLDIMIVNYDILKRLLDAPASSQRAKTKRTADRIHARSGTPNIHWDIIIADESHKLKNNSQRRSSFEKIARYSDKHDRAPFIMWLSATIGQNPIELAYLSPLVAQLRSKTNSTIKGWQQFLTEEGFTFSIGKAGDLHWVKTDSKDSAAVIATKRKQMAHDLNKIRTLLFSPESPSIRRSPEDIKGYPRIQRITAPIDISIVERIQYEKAWSEFVTEHKILAKKKDPVGALANQIRLRQKTSIIKAPHTVSQIEDLLENNHQVLVSVLYKDTAEKIAEALSKKGIKSVEYSGRIPTGTGEREQNRLAFQKGLVPVIIFSVTEAISLHAEELLSDGSNATSANRALVVHDLRYSSLDSIQIEGRGHRDGKSSNAYYPFLNNTVEGKILSVMLERMKNTKQLSGDSAADIAAVSDLYDRLVGI